MGQQYTFAGICMGVTKAGTQCRHIVVYANGFCNQHSGDSTEYMRERLEHARKKMLRRIAKRQRRLSIKDAPK